MGMPRGTRSAAIQRILFPMPGDDAALALYVRSAGASVEWTRDSLTIAPNASISFGTYFAAFPAVHWLAKTSVEQVTFCASITGIATIRLCAADEIIGRRVIKVFQADGEFTCDVELAEGSWLWVEIDAGGVGTIVENAEWRADDVTFDRTTVCVTTHNRGSDCVSVLERLAADSDVLPLLGRVYVVDQGQQRVRDTPGFGAAAAALGDRLRLIEQPNLGGSGGFSRGMIESLNEDVAHALLLDDDVILEPESIRRMLAFATKARGETIVGGQMLSLVDRTLLHSVGERVASDGFWWGPVDPTLAPIDLAHATIETTPGLRVRHDVDFNGWWMCLIPLALVRRMGAALPLFIKWDDAEFGLRAAAHGVPTVTLPGAAIWHMPWTGKDDGLDWQAYYQLRNRIVTALVHSPSSRGGGVLSSSFAQDVNHILCFQYGSAAARRTALRDVLGGPGHLSATIKRRTDDIRDLMARAGQVVVDDAQLPLASGRVEPVQPIGATASLRRLVAVLSHQFVRPRAPLPRTVDVALSRSSGKWWALGMLDSATVSSATGKGAFVARRSRRMSAVLFWYAVWLRVNLWLRWPRLGRAYRKAVPTLTSPAEWNSLTQ